MIGCAEKEQMEKRARQERNSEALATLPTAAPRPLLVSPMTQYLGSRLQRCYEVFDHFGFRDCDAAHHKEDQEGMVTGMGPAHLQNRTTSDQTAVMATAFLLRMGQRNLGATMAY